MVSNNQKSKIMATRSKIVFAENGKPFTAVYRHWDGYPSSAGTDLVNFIKPFQIVNGFGDKEEKGIANGISCLAAQFIATFKQGVGNYYMVFPDLSADSGEAYIYIFNQGTGAKFTVIDVWENKRHEFNDLDAALEFCEQFVD